MGEFYGSVGTWCVIETDWSGMSFMGQWVLGGLVRLTGVG